MRQMSNVDRLPSSFRDPSGFLYRKDDILFRQVNESFLAEYHHMIDSGLYQELIRRNYLIDHEEVDSQSGKTLRPRMLPYISYPYEWCWMQYRDAALLTLDIALLALEYGMCLKDASAYNIQFDGASPIFIDTLSFEKYTETPWSGYGQFCCHFLAPLALMSYCDQRLNELMRVYIDGIPLDMASQLLPFRSRLKPGLLFHIHHHAKSQKKYAGEKEEKLRDVKMSRSVMTAILQNLRSTICGLKFDRDDTEWAEYYANMLNYSDAAIDVKAALVERFLDRIKPETVCDLGANSGMFSAIAAENSHVVAYDIDRDAVTAHYAELSRGKKKNILPLLVDLTNPSPAIGWALRERQSLTERAPFDCVMALALVHHLAISNNVPLDMLAEYFAELGKWLIIEFVPKSDSQVRKLLATRKDIFTDYNEPAFEAVFLQRYELVEKYAIDGTERTLYLLKLKH